MFKPGDKVKFKSGDYAPNEKVYITNEYTADYHNLDISAIYSIEAAGGFLGGSVITIKGHNFYADRFILAESSPTFSVSDTVLLNDTLVTATVCDVSIPGLVRVKMGNGTLAFFEPQHLQKLPTDPGCEARLSSILMGVPTVKKIIHNGTTTITQFSDGTKIITRPSEDDADKYDPYVGWCVGVTAKLFGGKERAKKFYKAHSVVQKAVEHPASDEVELEPEQEKRECDTCGRSTDFKTIHCLECHWPELKYWRANSPSKTPPTPKPPAKPEPIEPVKAKVESRPIKKCYLCKDKALAVRLEPCLTCDKDSTDGYGHTQFTPQEDQKVEPEPSEARKQYDRWLSERRCIVCENDSVGSGSSPCKGCWDSVQIKPNFQAKPFEVKVSEKRKEYDIEVAYRWCIRCKGNDDPETSPMCKDCWDQRDANPPKPNFVAKPFKE